MKRISLLLFPLLCILALLSCTTDSYEQGEGDMSLMTAEFGLMQTDAEGALCSFLSDEMPLDAKPLPLNRRYKAEWAKDPNINVRTLLYYNNEGGVLRVRKVEPIPTRKLVKPEDATPLKTDPIDWTSTWLSTNGAFLNLAFSLKCGAVDADDQLHVIKIVCDEITEDAGKHTYRLTMYHDQNSIPEYYSVPTYLSIPVKDNFAAGSDVILRINTYKGWKEKTITLP